MAFFGMFGSPEKSDKKVLKLVETTEGLIDPDSSGAIDEKKLPMRRKKFGPMLLAEITRLHGLPGTENEVRRYANCYLQLARFLPGVDRAHAAVLNILTPGHGLDLTRELFHQIFTAGGALDRRAAEEQDVAQAELRQIGIPTVGL